MMFQTRSILLAGAVLIGGGVGGTTASHADPYRWCAEYSIYEGSATNCYFSTIEQCRAAVSGVGGFCRPNLFYDGVPYGTDPARRRPPKKRR